MLVANMRPSKPSGRVYHAYDFRDAYRCLLWLRSDIAREGWGDRPPREGSWCDAYGHESGIEPLLQ